MASENGGADEQALSLADFLLARIAETEAAAKAATAVEGGATMMALLPGPLYDHAAHHLPKRVIAECDATRRVVGLHKPESGAWAGDYRRCSECAGSQWPCRTLRVLALPYADHPDFREDWWASGVRSPNAP